MDSKDSRLRLALALNQNQNAYEKHVDEYVRTGPNRLIQSRRWLSPVFEFLERADHPCKVLELGTADGYLTGLLCDLGHSVTAVEFTNAMANATRKQATRARVIESEFLSYRFASKFDVVIASAFIHLFPPPFDLSVACKIHELLAVNGIGFLATTIHESYNTGIEQKVDAKSWSPRYRTRFTKESFESLIDSSRLTICRYYQAVDFYHADKIWGNWIVEAD